MTVESESPQPEQATYRPKPPLWTAPRERKSPILLAVAIISVASLLGLVILGGEDIFFASSAEPVEVLVLRIDGVNPPNDAPADYRYNVRLPEGREARYTRPDIHHVGEKVTVLRSRGRVTGRVHLTRPRGPARSNE